MTHSASIRPEFGVNLQGKLNGDYAIRAKCCGVATCSNRHWIYCQTHRARCKHIGINIPGGNSDNK